MTNHPATAVAADGADLLALVELALGEAKSLGASQAEAAVSMDVGLSVSVRLGEVETIEYQRDRGMSVTVYFGTRKGSASTADLGAAALRETVAKACSIARLRESPIPTRSRRTSRTSTWRTPGTSRRNAPSNSRSSARPRRWRWTSASPTPRARA